MKTRIIVNLALEGTHCWPSCHIAEVDFLRNTHRHMFHICCKKEVSHLDRDIEIIRYKRRIAEHLTKKYGTPAYCDFGAMSCEMIAEELMRTFSLSYCSVLEDGENGAEITNE